MDKENVVYIVYKKVAYLDTIEYYSTFIQKEILPYVITWMNLEDILLSEIRPSQKDKYYRIPLNWDI